jgi:hypothetical protein
MYIKYTFEIQFYKQQLSCHVEKHRNYGYLRRRRSKNFYDLSEISQNFDTRKRLPGKIPAEGVKTGEKQE